MNPTLCPAAGKRAKALHDGAFVWADSQNADFTSDRADQFKVRAYNGAKFDDNDGNWVELLYGQAINTSTGGYLSWGGVWTDACDRARKENFSSVDGCAVLEKLADLPISTWNYKAEDSAVRHLGPVGQDFYAAFGLGTDDKHIATLDTSGVALAAIQGLYEIVQEKDGEIVEQCDQIGAQQAQIAVQQVRIAELSARLERVEALLTELVRPPPSERMGHPQVGGAR